jgi:hypothetical protein
LTGGFGRLFRFWAAGRSHGAPNPARADGVPLARPSGATTLHFDRLSAPRVRRGAEPLRTSSADTDAAAECAFGADHLTEGVGRLVALAVGELLQLVHPASSATRGNAASEM